MKDSSNDIQKRKSDQSFQSDWISYLVKKILGNRLDWTSIIYLIQKKERDLISFGLDTGCLIMIIISSVGGGKSAQLHEHLISVRLHCLISIVLERFIRLRLEILISIRLECLIIDKLGEIRKSDH